MSLSSGRNKSRAWWEIRETLPHVVAQQLAESLTAEQREYLAPVLERLETLYSEGLKQVLSPGLPMTKAEFDERVLQSQASISGHIRNGCAGE